jgi:hypothetical protein
MPTKKDVEQIVWPSSADPLINFIRKCQLITKQLDRSTRTKEQIREAAIKAFCETNSKSTDAKD